MEDDDNRQFKEANAAVTRAVAAFVSEIESMFGKWEDVVAPSYLVEIALLDLSTAVSELTDEFKDIVGPATSKLLDALAAYRDFAATGPLTPYLRLTTLAAVSSSIRHSRLSSSATRWAGTRSRSTECWTYPAVTSPLWAWLTNAFKAYTDISVPRPPSRRSSLSRGSRR